MATLDKAGMAIKKYRGYRRCSRIDYSSGANYFVLTICVAPRRPVFTRPDYNLVIVHELTEVNNAGYWGVYAYCLMPDHVHLVVSPGPKGLAEAVRRFKGRTSTEWRKTGDGQSLWQPSYFDHRIRSAESFAQKCSYVFDNPVRAGLVKEAAAYQWSGSLVRR